LDVCRDAFARQVSKLLKFLTIHAFSLPLA
jgi:hypothetical protein